MVYIYIYISLNLLCPSLSLPVSSIRPEIMIKMNSDGSHIKTKSTVKSIFYVLPYIMLHKLGILQHASPAFLTEGPAQIVISSILFS